jgi:hypothetical protein
MSEPEFSGGGPISHGKNEDFRPEDYITLHLESGNL